MNSKAKKPEGRPPVFKSLDELDKKIAEYFEYIQGECENPTITGLALFLGFNSRQSFYNYEAKPEFLDSIKRARLKVESTYEQHLFTKTPAGAIFALKNFGWSDKQEVEHSGQVSIPALSWASDKET